jgi:cyclopropane-fatty-acyl-phospholipid synthase
MGVAAWRRSGSRGSDIVAQWRRIRRVAMNAQLESSPIASTPKAAPRDERLFFELVGAALNDEALTFVCDGREYHYGGARPPTVVRITHPDFFRRVLTRGNLGLGEAYMFGEFEIDRGSLEQLLVSLARSNIEGHIRSNPLYPLKLAGIYARNFFRGRYRNVQSHYDLGEDLFAAFLDESMAYSCGYVVAPDDELADLQRQKFDRICRKLRLKPGERLLDIGCGFGGLLIHAATHYGVRGTGITISRHHHRTARAKVEAHGLSGEVEIVFASHHALPGRFEKIVSVGMFEHLTRRDYPVFFANIKGALVEDGLGLLHTVGCTSVRNRHDPFIQKYMLPGSRTPKLSELAIQLEKNDLPILDVENTVRHYAPTLRAWNDNLQRTYPTLDHRQYDETCKRMFEYFFACGMAGAIASNAAVFQVLFANSFTIDMPWQRV